MNQNYFLQGIIIIVSILVSSLIIFDLFYSPSFPDLLSDSGNTEEKNSGSYIKLDFVTENFTYEELRSNIRNGGPPPDGIPPIENPQYITRESANDFLLKDDIVFGLNLVVLKKIFLINQVFQENGTMRIILIH